MKPKRIQVDVNSRAGAAFQEAVMELPWQKPNQVFADHRYEVSEVKLPSGSTWEIHHLIKSDPTFLYRGHGALDPQTTRDGYIHATPLPDVAIDQYCIFNGGGPVRMDSPELEAVLGINVARLAFLSQYVAKSDQVFYSDEQLELKMGGQPVDGKRLADITRFDSNDHFETQIDIHTQPRAMYVVLGAPSMVKDDGSLGALSFPVRLAKIMENGEITPAGAKFLRLYQSITEESLPKALLTQSAKRTLG